MQRFVFALLFASSPVLAQSLEDLDAACYNARAAKIKVVQQRMIEECVKAPADYRGVAKSRAECEQYWGSYGWTKAAANGKRQPYLYRDLPACHRAAEARAKAQ